MTLRPALARLERGFKRLWSVAKRRLGLNVPGWGSEPVNEDHATYRRQYEETLALLKHLPRGVHHERAFERRNTILYFAELIDGLHNYGDDPIMPPGIKRIVVHETQRLAQFGEVGQRRRFFASPAALALGGVRPWMIWTGLVSVLALLLGFQSVRLESAKANLREARQTMEQAQEERDDWRDRATQYAQAVTDARAVARQSADALEAERAAQARAAARERRRQREIQNVIADSPEPPAWSLRDSGEVSQ